MIESPAFNTQGDLAKLAASDFAGSLDENLRRLGAHSELCKPKKPRILAKMLQKTCCVAHFRNLQFLRTNFARFPQELSGERMLTFSALYRLVWLSWMPLFYTCALLWLLFSASSIVLDAPFAFFTLDIPMQISFVFAGALLSIALAALVCLAARCCFLIARERNHFFYSFIRALVLSIWHAPLTFAMIILRGGSLGAHDLGVLLVASLMFFFLPSIVLVVLVEQKLARAPRPSTISPAHG